MKKEPTQETVEVVAKKASVTIQSVEAQSTPLRVLGSAPTKVLNREEVDSPFVSFSIQLTFETDQGLIVVSGNLEGFQSRWEGEIFSSEELRPSGESIVKANHQGRSS